MPIHENTIYIGGSFTQVNSIERLRLAAIDLTTKELTSFNHIFNNSPYGLQVTGDTLFLAGAFTAVDGVARNRIAAIKLSTNELLPFNMIAESTSGSITRFAVTDKTIFISGDGFSVTKNGTTINKLAAIDRSTGEVLDWNPNLNNTINNVYSLEKHDTSLYVMGNFTSISNEPRKYVASYNISNLALTEFEIPGYLGSTTYALTVAKNKMYIEGDIVGVNKCYQFQKEYCCNRPQLKFINRLQPSTFQAHW